MKKKKRVVFLTGTRADFGKLKSLIEKAVKSQYLEVFIFVTGMHMSVDHGSTVEEVENLGFKNVIKFDNQTSESTMDLTLAKTIQGLSKFFSQNKPDLLVVHGDRLEALAGAISGAFNNVLVAHVEGGEVSGTIDELIRHSVSKLSHIHLVSNELAKKRLIQMGEIEKSIFIIGSPDIDIMRSNKLPTLNVVRERYDIFFEEYSIVLFHPVTTELNRIKKYSNELVRALIDSGEKFVVIFPNNDMGYNHILESYEMLKNRSNFKIFPSIRFEYFLVLLKFAKLIIGNSSAGIREAPYYGIPAVNIGSRQNNRAINEGIINSNCDSESILNAIKKALTIKCDAVGLFGKGDSAEEFMKILESGIFWDFQNQKLFNDIEY